MATTEYVNAITVTGVPASAHVSALAHLKAAMPKATVTLTADGPRSWSALRAGGDPYGNGGLRCITLAVTSALAEAEGFTVPTDDTMRKSPCYTAFADPRTGKVWTPRTSEQAKAEGPAAKPVSPKAPAPTTTKSSTPKAKPPVKPVVVPASEQKAGKAEALKAITQACAALKTVSRSLETIASYIA